LAPDFSLPNALGSYTSLEDALKVGAAVVTFYRGGWCPYCNLQLRVYQAVLPAIEASGAMILAVSPQLPDKSLSTSEKNALKFSILSDVGNSIARKFGLVYSLPEELRAALRSNGKELPGINGDETWELPVPATFVIDADKRVVFSFEEIDYRRRLAPEDLVSALRSIVDANESAS
jgi:peroxiredoxin